MGAVILILIGISGIGHRDGGWPIMTWPMYSTYEPVRPPSIASLYEVRIVETDSSVRVMTARDLAPMGWVKAAGQILRSAYQDSLPMQRDSSRAYIARQAALRIPAARIARIEGWRRDWRCDPLASPPIDYTHPLGDVLVGAFSISEFPHTLPDD